MANRTKLQTTVNPSTLVALEEIQHRLDSNRAQAVDFAVQLAYEVMSAAYDRDTLPPASVGSALRVYDASVLAKKLQELDGIAAQFQP